MNIIRGAVISIIILIAVFFYIVSRNYCKDCNVILISIDTLRADHLSAYGYPRKTSPNIDEFAKNALVFRNFYSTSSWTLPAHASMFASDMPASLKMQTIFDRMPKSTLTLAEVLQKNGYYNQGFDSLTYISPRWNFSKGFNSYTLEVTDSNVNDANLIFTHATDWIQKNSKKKFFLFLHTFQVHDPYCPPVPYRDMFRGDYVGNVECVNIEEIIKQEEGKEDFSRKDLSRYISLYDGDIALADFQIGRFLKSIKTLGLDKKTIVIIVSDHGEEFGEHGVWGQHGKTLYNEVLKIPLIIKAPNLKSGIVQTPASMIDIAPTIIELIGISKQAQFRGESLRLKDTNSPLFFELATTGIKLKQGLDQQYQTTFDTFPTQRGEEKVDMEKVGVLVGNWKLTKDYLTGKLELFDILHDEPEKNNLISKYPLVTKRLEKLLFNKYNPKNNPASNKTDNNILKESDTDLDRVNKLKSLGY